MSTTAPPQRPVRDAAATAAALVAPGKGILAADESTATMNKRLAEVLDRPPEDDDRRAFRELLFTTEGAAASVSGAILYDETLRQRASDGTPFGELLARQGMIPGIKVDTGAKPLAGAPGETVTEGLDGLRDRIAEYAALGARFAKWRAVIAVGPDRPSAYCIGVNAHALARYAGLCQEGGVTPIIEPEVLMAGDHTIDRAEEVTLLTLRAVFAALAEQRVALDALLLKPNMVVAGAGCPRQPGVEEVAARTLDCLRRTVPAEVPGIVFLSGGQSDAAACAHLDAMNRSGAQPWELSFSYGRALQATPLAVWGGRPERRDAAQDAYARRARCTAAARQGLWTAELEREPAVAA